MGKLIDDRWEVIRVLGQGGQGQALLVRDVTSPQKDEYVLKQLMNVKRSARFQKEAESISKLQHPNVLRLVGSNVNADRPYLVTEYCEQGSLEENKAAILELDRDERLEMFEEICDGVAAIHEARMVHRDIKPANIFLRKDWTPVVGDFGLAFVEDTDRPTETMEAVGARWYMAPELAEGRLEAVAPQADVYSLGKLLYWLLTGRIFDRERHRKSPNNVLGYYPLDESMENVNVLLDRMIVENPRNRYPNASELRNNVGHVRRLLAGQYPSLTAYPQLCRYCGRDMYVKLPNDSTAIKNIGLNAVSGSKWHMFRCKTCGHMLTFHNAGWLERLDEQPETIKLKELMDE